MRKALKKRMKKHLYIIFAFCLFAQISLANVITGQAAIPDNYYKGVDGKSGADNILDALNSIINGHTVINYDGLEPYYKLTDFYADTLWDIYSTCRFDYEDANPQQTKVCDGWNKEHVVCQSWLGSGAMVSDLYNVYPTDARVNNFRSNYPYGEVNAENGFGITKDDDKHALGKLGTSTHGAIPNYSTTSNYTESKYRVFEPHDNYKGDLARTLMYMVARYRSNTLNDGNGKAMFVSGKTNFTEYAREMLLRWHRQDPVSLKEIDRNQAIYDSIQHNRNPFIDYPDLAEYVWGNKVGQAVDLSKLVPSCDEVIPYIETKFGVTWKVFGQTLKIDSVEGNSKVSTFPSAPTSCSTTSNTFVGWTTTPISGITQSAPSPLFTNKIDAPAVTKDVTYYAVYAHAETTEGQGSVTASTQFTSYKRGNEVTSEKIGNVTATFDQAGASNPTKFYTEVRCYAKSTITFSGATMTKIVFTAGKEDKGNAFTPNTGTINGSTWTGNASSVKFTVGGDNGYRGIGAIAVTYNDNTVFTTYSDYLTSCDGSTTGIDNPKSNIEYHKILRNGQILILRDGHIYNLMGQQIE